MALFIVPLVALSQVLAYYRADIVDDQMFAYFGWRIANGATVYLDVWDNKPPGVYWINAVGMLLGNGSYLGVIAMCTLGLLVAHAAFFLAARAVFQRGAAGITTVLLSFYLTHAYYTGGTNRTETFLVAFELIGVALYLWGCVRGRWWFWYAAGLSCGVAFLFKQVGLAAWGCMGLHTILLVLLRDLPVNVGVRRCLLLLGGALTSVGLAAFVLAGQGALSAACFATFGFNRTYFAAGASEFPYSFVSYKLLKQHIALVLHVPLLMSVAALIHAFLWWLRPWLRPIEIVNQLRRDEPEVPRYMFFLTAWALTAWYGALMSPHAFRHYLVPTVPPLLMLSGYLVNVLRAEARLLHRMQRRAWVTTAIVILAYFAWTALRTQLNEVSKVWVFRIDPQTREPAEWEPIAEAVKQFTVPGDRIQCFGYLPGVYLHSRRVNATRFTTTEKIGQVGTGAQFVVDEMETRLRDDPPVALVMSAGDYFWMRGLLPDVPPSRFDLGSWIDENYAPVYEIPKFGTYYVFKRRDLLKPGEQAIELVLPEDLAGTNTSAAITDARTMTPPTIFGVATKT